MVTGPDQPALRAIDLTEVAVNLLLLLMNQSSLERTWRKWWDLEKNAGQESAQAITELLKKYDGKPQK